ncbi:MAG: hypothetical protein IPM42_17180 [Saprospiraceae bacterium]|nr:hypothetical protein [Saprospiraceae bacterium]
MDNTVDYYEPEVVQASDYYPFGGEMPGRTYRNPAFDGTNNYRFGFNGKELDKSGEFGSLTHYDYGFRIYNPSIGKFLSVDPLTKSYPMLTPYQFASNTPIQAIDLDGLEAKMVVHEIGSNSITSFEIDLNDPKVNPNTTLHANQAKFSKRGDLTVIKKVGSDEVLLKYEIGIIDWAKNVLDGNRGGTMFFLKHGKGKESRISPNSEIGQNLDDLFDAFGMAKAVNNRLSSIPAMIDYANTAIQKLGLNEEGYQNSKHYFEGKVEPNVHKKEIKGVGSDGEFEYTGNTVVSSVSQKGDSVTHYRINEFGDTIKSKTFKAIEKKSAIMRQISRKETVEVDGPVKNPKK